MKFKKIWYTLGIYCLFYSLSQIYFFIKLNNVLYLNLFYVSAFIGIVIVCGEFEESGGDCCGKSKHK